MSELTRDVDDRLEEAETSLVMAVDNLTLWVLVLAACYKAGIMPFAATVIVCQLVGTKLMVWWSKR